VVGACRCCCVASAGKSLTDYPWARDERRPFLQDLKGFVPGPSLKLRLESNTGTHLIVFRSMYLPGGQMLGKMRGVVLVVLSASACCQGTPLSVFSDPPLQLVTATGTAAASPATTKETDICLSRKFLAVSHCNDINPEWTNSTLAAAGFKCCWEVVLSLEGNPKLSFVEIPVPYAAQRLTPNLHRAWLTLDENGDVTRRCVYRGGCVSGL